MAVIAVFRRLFHRIYLRTYRRERGIDDSELARWRYVHAAARLAEGFESERDALLAILSRGGPAAAPAAGR